MIKRSFHEKAIAILNEYVLNNKTVKYVRQKQEKQIDLSWWDISIPISQQFVKKLDRKLAKSQQYHQSAGSSQHL